MLNFCARKISLLAVLTLSTVAFASSQPIGIFKIQPKQPTSFAARHAAKQEAARQERQLVAAEVEPVEEVAEPDATAGDMAKASLALYQAMAKGEAVPVHNLTAKTMQIGDANLTDVSLILAYTPRVDENDADRVSMKISAQMADASGELHAVEISIGDSKGSEEGACVNGRPFAEFMRFFAGDTRHIYDRNLTDVATDLALTVAIDNTRLTEAGILTQLFGLPSMKAQPVPFLEKASGQLQLLLSSGNLSLKAGKGDASLLVTVAKNMPNVPEDKDTNIEISGLLNVDLPDDFFMGAGWFGFHMFPWPFSDGSTTEMSIPEDQPLRIKVPAAYFMRSMPSDMLARTHGLLEQGAEAGAELYELTISGTFSDKQFNVVVTASDRPSQSAHFTANGNLFIGLMGHRPPMLRDVQFTLEANGTAAEDGKAPSFIQYLDIYTANREGGLLIDHSNNSINVNATVVPAEFMSFLAENGIKFHGKPDVEAFLEALPEVEIKANILRPDENSGGQIDVSIKGAEQNLDFATQIWSGKVWGSNGSFAWDVPASIQKLLFGYETEKSARFSIKHTEMAEQEDGTVVRDALPDEILLDVGLLAHILAAPERTHLAAALAECTTVVGSDNAHFYMKNEGRKVSIGGTEQGPWTELSREAMQEFGSLIQGMMMRFRPEAPEKADK